MSVRRFLSRSPSPLPTHARITGAACLVVPLLLVFAGCSDDDADDTTSAASSSASGSGGAGGAGGSGASGAQGGAGGAGGSGAQGGSAQGGGGAGASGGAGGSAGGDGGSGGGSALTCDGIQEDVGDWLLVHQSCNDANPCQRISNVESAGWCDQVAAPGADQPALDGLMNDWKTQGCTFGGSCGFTPGDAECINGSCQLVIDNDCALCPDTFDPVCTVGGANAINACYATDCLKDQVDHPGFCADSPQCTAEGGTCNETFFYQPPCPDGTQWDVANTDHGCPGGNLRNYCCTPYSEPCSFVSFSGTLSLDPFTCQDPTGPGAPWTCIHMPDQQTCTIPASIEQPFNEVYDAEVTVQAHFGNTVTVTGVHNETGDTFTCNGVVSYDFATIETWTCTACAGGNPNACTTCTIEESGYCQL